MKTLFLVRHAKSSRDDPSLPDRDRPLDDRGKQDGPKMGKRLAKRDVKPDLLLSSPALRALTTAQLIAEEIGYKLKDIVVDDRLYASERRRLACCHSRARQEAQPRDALRPQPGVHRSRASAVERDHRHAHLRCRRVPLRHEGMVRCRREEAGESGIRLSEEVVRMVVGVGLHLS